MTAALYTRVSTLNQVERDSLSSQESRLRAYCEAKSYSVYKVYKDAGESAKDRKRPALEELLKDIKAGKVQTVLVTKLDRITRSLKDLLFLVEFFHKHAVKFVSITQNIDSSGPFGRFMRDLLGLIARLEREVTAQRVSEDMHHRATLGKWNGGIIPYGYTTQHRLAREFQASGMPSEEALLAASKAVPEAKKLFVDEKEAKVVREIFSSYMETRSLRKTTSKLNSSGIKTRKGGLWTPTSLKRILTNPTYIGKTWYGKRRTDLETGRLEPSPSHDWTIVEGRHDALVSPEQFREAGEILASRERKPTRANRTYLLSGLLRCGKCGTRMHGYTFTKKGSGKTYSYYKCHRNVSQGKEACPGMTVPAQPLDDFVVETLMDLSKDRTFLNDKELMLKTLREECENASTGKSERLARLVSVEKDLQARLDTLLEKLEQGLIDDKDFSMRYRKVKQDLAENQVMQQKAEDVYVHPDSAVEALNASFEEVASFGNNWNFLDDEGKKVKVGTVVKEIKVFKDKVDIQVFLDVDNLTP
jgi:site-specific DNA recombinase